MINAENWLRAGARWQASKRAADLMGLLLRAFVPRFGWLGRRHVAPSACVKHLLRAHGEVMPEQAMRPVRATQVPSKINFVG